MRQFTGSSLKNSISSSHAPHTFEAGGANSYFIICHLAIILLPKVWHGWDAAKKLLSSGLMPGVTDHAGVGVLPVVGIGVGGGGGMNAPEVGTGAT